MIIAGIILLFLFLFLNYIFLVPIGLYWSSFFYICILITLAASVIYSIANKGKKEDTIIGTAIVTGSGIIITLLLALGIVFFTSPIFMAGSYKSLLPKPQEKVLAKEIVPFDVTKAPIVTESTAEQIADKQIGELGDIGSRAELGELTLQSVNGELYWVAPLAHAGFFAWMNNKDAGTPYIMVNANNKVSKVVQSNIIIQPQSFFGQDLKRVLYNNDKFAAYTDFTFEVDDSGHPYWTATIMKNKVGLFRGSSPVGTAIVDAETGTVKEYDIQNTPSWVDRIQPMDIAVRDANYYGTYINGFKPFNNNGKTKTTDGKGIVYNNEKCYYYTGITSVGKDDSTLGFYLIDTRTMETTYFKMSGATEDAAIKSAEGKVQNLGYTGSFPILMNVENSATYFVPLQDKNNLTKLYAMVNVSDYTIIATGETAEECKEAYVQALSAKNVIANTSGEKKDITSVVKRINSFVQQGDTFYSILLNDSEKVFIVPLNQSPFISLTKEGDSVKIEYVDSSAINGTFSSASFKNLTIGR